MKLSPKRLDRILKDFEKRIIKEAEARESRELEKEIALIYNKG